MTRFSLASPGGGEDPTPFFHTLPYLVRLSNSIRGPKSEYPTRMEPKVHPNGSELEAAWTPLLESALAGEISVQEAARNIADIMRSIVSR